MGIQIDLGVHKRPGKLFNAVRRASAGQFVGKIFGVVRGQGCRFRIIHTFLR